MHQELELARAYVPMQPFEQLFPPQESLMKGTVFPGLYRPYPPRPTEERV